MWQTRGTRGLGRLTERALHRGRHAYQGTSHVRSVYGDDSSDRIGSCVVLQRQSSRVKMFILVSMMLGACKFRLFGACTAKA